MMRDGTFVNVLPERVVLTMLVQDAPEVTVGRTTFRPGKVTLSVHRTDEHACIGVSSSTLAGHSGVLGGHHDESQAVPDWLMAIATTELPRVRLFCEAAA